MGVSPNAGTADSPRAELSVAAASYFAAQRDDLVDRAIAIAKAHGYAQYTTTVRAAWIEAIDTITECLGELLADTPAGALGPEAEVDYGHHPAFRRLREVARRHRALGITLQLYLGLFKRFRDVYLEVLDGLAVGPDARVILRTRIMGIFDAADLSIAADWSEGGAGSEARGDSDGADDLGRFPLTVRPAAQSPQPTRRLLVIDDDAAVRGFLRDVLSAAGYQVAEAESAVAAQRRILAESWDLVLLDRRLPDTDGLLLLKYVREQSDCPVIVLTLLDDEHDRLLGLGLGAADYIAKPFSAVEICLRVRRVLETHRRIEDSFDGAPIARGPFALVRATRRLSVDGAEHHLTSAETRLMALFLARPGAVRDRTELTRRVCYREWSYNDRTIDVLVARLRRRIERDPKAPEWIVTVHGVGYVFDPQGLL